MRVYFAPGNDHTTVYKLVCDYDCEESFPIPHNPSSMMGCSNLQLVVENRGKTNYSSVVWACFGREIVKGYAKYQEETEDEWNVVNEDETRSVLTSPAFAYSSDFFNGLDVMNCDTKYIEGVLKPRADRAVQMGAEVAPLRLHCFREMRP